MTSMRHIFRTVCALVAFFVFILTSSPVTAQEHRLYLKFKKNKITVDIKNTPLKEVLNEFEDRKDISIETGFIRDESLLQNNVSLELHEVSIQEAIDRILSGINYSLLYRGDKVTSVTLFGEPGKRIYRRRSPATRRSYRRRP